MSASIRSCESGTLGVAIVVLITSSVGCSKVSFAQVDGTVTMDGTPLAGVVVTYYPVADGSDGHSFATGTTDELGHYRLTSARGKDGGIVGTNRVVISWPTRERTDNPEASRKDRRPSRLIPLSYTVASETPLTAEVKAGGPQTINLELDGKLPPPKSAR
jgi:hypothetical protein